MKAPKNFEEGICRLEEILATIAEESTPITQAVKLYAEAAQILEYCNAVLSSATLQIEEIDAKVQKATTPINSVEDDIL